MTVKEQIKDFHNKKWRVSKEIPAALIFGLGVQFFGFVWFWATFTAETNGRFAEHNLRLNMIESNRDTARVNQNAQEIAVLSRAMTDLKVSNQRDVKYLQEGMLRIENKLDRIIQNKISSKKSD